MKLLLFAMSAFGIALCIHGIIWRIRTPKGQTSALLKLFSLVYIVAIFISSYGGISQYVPVGIWERLHFTVFYIPSALTYISLYSLIEHDSPSLAIIERLAQAGNSGCTYGELSALFAEEDIIEHRLRAAAGNGLVQSGDSQWMLTPKGRLFGRIFDAAARVYRFERAG